MQVISVSFSVSDNYSQHLAVVISSFLSNTPKREFVFHVLHQNITDENQRKIKELEHFANCREIVFHRLDMSQFDGFVIPKELEHISIEMYFRYLLPRVLKDEVRTIYSDVDVLAVQDVSRLWEVDLGDNLLGAVLDHKPNTPGFQKYKCRLGMKADTPYFYSGLLVMDLARIRRGNYVEMLFEKTLQLKDKISWPDQDIINLVFMGKIKSLADTWNATDKYSFFRRDVKIWHFPGFVQKPWCNIWKNYTWLPYLRYLLRSPFKKNALRFVLGHIAGFFYFRYTKKQVERILICGILIYKRKVA